MELSESQGKLQKQSHSRLDAMSCALAVGVCVVLVWPFSGVPFSDDFSYCKTALDFAHTGHLRYNGWATALLGWQVVWGAAFIRVFGFSFSVLRLSLLPFAMANAYLFHVVLSGFGLRRAIAIFGTLTLCLSPLILPLTASFMTDMTGLFVVVLCMYMCQKAVRAPDSRGTIAWLLTAALINLVGGTVRQTSWLGALVIVPFTALYLRRRPYVLATGVAVAIGSVAVIHSALRWAARQLYFQREPILVHPFGIAEAQRAGAQLARTALCLTFVLLPVMILWLPAAGQLSRRAKAFSACVLGMCGIAGIALHSRAMLSEWLVPWLLPYLASQGMQDPDPLVGAAPSLSHPVRLIISAAVGLIGVIVAAAVVSCFRRRGVACGTEFRTALWLLGPFSVIYLVTLLPRAARFIIQDRYLLELMPAGIALLLIGYQRWIWPRFLWVGTFALAVFCAFGVAGTHNYFAEQRAAEAATQEVMRSGVPRVKISESYPSDAWEQLRLTGTMNNPEMVGADKSYRANVPIWKLPAGCTTYMPQLMEPDIRPTYFVAWSETRCLKRSRFPPVRYRSWLPPFDRYDYVGELSSESK